MKKDNYKFIGYTLLGIFLVVGAFLIPKPSFEKEKVETSGFGGYTRPDKSSQNSSLPSNLRWDDPYFQMSKSKTNVK